MSNDKKVCPGCGAELDHESKGRLYHYFAYECGSETCDGLESFEQSDQCKINALKAETDQLKFELTIAASVIRKFKAEIAELRKMVQYCFTEMETVANDLDDHGFDKINELVDKVVARFKELNNE